MHLMFSLLSYSYKWFATLWLKKVQMKHSGLAEVPNHSFENQSENSLSPIAKRVKE
jgi:hypothetical protein